MPFLTGLAMAALARLGIPLAGRALPVAAGAAAGATGGFLGGLSIGEAGGGPRRRRRKRVLTANDRADISFITATLGAPAGKAFAMIVAARV